MTKRQLYIFCSYLVCCGCNRTPVGYDRSITKFEVDGKAFTTNDLSMIATNTGFSFPSGTEGINFLYDGDYGPPCLLAKLRLPADAQSQFESTLNAMPDLTNGDYTSYFTNGVKWWSESKDKILVDKVSKRGRDLTHAILSKQEKGLFLYIEWYY